jgi:hypothetical protein
MDKARKLRFPNIGVMSKVFQLLSYLIYLECMHANDTLSQNISSALSAAVRPRNPPHSSMFPTETQAHAKLRRHRASHIDQVTTSF